jgi:hypothetical protein
MVIAIHDNRKKSHDHVNDISEFSSKNQSEWYITSHTLIRFSQFDANYHKVEDIHKPPMSRGVTIE